MDIPKAEVPDEEGSLEPSPEPEGPAKEPRRLAKQDQRLTNDVRRAQAMILKLRELPDAAALMAEHGFDHAELDRGLARYQAALEAITARSDAISRKELASAALNGADLTAREVYADFRTVTRPFYPSAGDRSALAVSGSTPKDRDAFLVKAHDAFGSGRQEPYAEQLALIGFGAQVMLAAEKTLDALERADAAHKASLDVAVQATRARDAAAAELIDWVAKLEGVLKVVLKGHPSLATILNPPL